MKVLLMMVVAFEVLMKCYGQKRNICTATELMAAIREACTMDKRGLDSAMQPFYFGRHLYGSFGQNPRYLEEPSDNDYDVSALLPIRETYNLDNMRSDGGFIKSYLPRPSFFHYFWPPTGPRRGKRMGTLNQEMVTRCCVEGCTQNDFRGACHFEQ